MSVLLKIKSAFNFKVHLLRQQTPVQLLPVSMPQNTFFYLNDNNYDCAFGFNLNIKNVKV